MSEDGKGITRELEYSLAVADCVNVPVQKLGADEHGTRQVFHDDERDAVQRIAEPHSQQNFAGRSEYVAGRIAKRLQVLVRGDELFPSLGQ